MNTRVRATEKVTLRLELSLADGFLITRYRKPRRTPNVLNERLKARGIKPPRKRPCFKSRDSYRRWRKALRNGFYRF
jgi:hypothetical protein